MLGKFNFFKWASEKEQKAGPAPRRQQIFPCAATALMED
jgi:hypothetical protein